MNSYSSSTTQNLDNLPLRSLMSRLQIHPPSNPPSPQSLEDLLFNTLPFSSEHEDKNDGNDDDDDDDNNNNNKKQEEEEEYEGVGEEEKIGNLGLRELIESGDSGNEGRDMNAGSTRCRHTLVGKFTNSMPKMEVIRKSVIQKSHLTGGVKIAPLDSRHIYIDLDNEEDHVAVWITQRMYIEGQMMKLQMWTPTFRPEEETPIVPIWVTLPQLPCHCFCLEFITPLLSPIGKVLYLDKATIQKTRGSYAKARLQFDLTKERHPRIWIGFDEEDLTYGFWQKIRYEKVPEYCLYCKHQGHVVNACNVKRRDDEYKRRKELKADNKLKNKVAASSNKQAIIEQKQNNTQGPTQWEDNHHGIATTSGTNSIADHIQQELPIPKENQWQTQKRRNCRGHTRTGKSKQAHEQQIKVYKTCFSKETG